MKNRDAYPEIARVVDEFRAFGMGAGAAVRHTENGRTFAWTEPDLDVDAILEARGWDKLWCAQQRALTYAKFGKK